MIKTLKYLFIAIIAAVFGASLFLYNTMEKDALSNQPISFGGPVAQNFTNIQPFIDNTYDNGTSTNAWKNLFTYGLKFSTSTTGCLQGKTTGSFVTAYFTGSDCGSGGGVGTSTNPFMATYFVATSTTATSTFPVLYSSTSTISNLNNTIYVDGIAYAKNATGIQAALNLCSFLGGGTVLLPTGTTTITSRITPVSNCTLAGMGMGATVLYGGVAFDYMFAKIGTGGIQNFNVRDLTMDNASTSSGSIMRLEYATNVHIDRVRFINTPGWELYIGVSNAVDTEPRNSNIFINESIFDVSSSTLEQLLIFNSKGVSVTNSIFRSNTRTNGPGAGIYQIADDITFDGNTFENIAGPSLYYSLSTNNINITNNWFLGTSTGIQGANLSDNGAFGYGLVRGLRVENNHFTNNVIGLELGATDGAIVTGNTFEENTQIGIYVNQGNAGASGYARNFKITNNTFRRNNTSNTFSVLHPPILFGQIGGNMYGNISDNTFYDNAPGGIYYQPLAISFSGVYAWDYLTFSNNRLESVGAYTDVPINILDYGATIGNHTVFINNYNMNPDSFNDYGNITGAVEFTRKDGRTIKSTLTGNITATIHTGPTVTTATTTGIATGDDLTLWFVQDSTGGRTITWPSNAILVGGDFQPNPTANSTSMLHLRWDGPNAKWVETSRSNSGVQIYPSGILSTASSTFSSSFRLPSLSDGCLNITSGLVGSTGSACGSGGGGISNPFTNSFMTVPSLGVQYTSATTSALKITSLATTTISNLNGMYVVPTDFAINGCAGNAAYTDFGQCVNGLYSLASTSGNYAVKIKIPRMKVTSSQWTTAMNFNINGLGIELECDRGATLIWGGTGTSTIINTGNPTGHYVSEITGCSWQGNPTLIAAGNSNTKTTGGIFFGGSNGGVGINFHDNNVNGFGQNIAWGGPSGAHSYMITVRSNSISGGNGNILGNSIYVGTANDSGERNIIDGNSITDPSDGIATSSVYFISSATASNFITNNSIDNVGLYLGASNGMFYIAGNHFENPGAPSGYTQYIPIYNPSSDGSTSITLIGNEFANSASNQTWETIIKHGAQLYASGNRIDNYNGFTVTNFADHSNNNGQSSDHVCQTQVQGGSLTNIIAGSGGTTWSLTNGVACVTNRSNSYTIGLRPLATNVNEFFSGNSVTGTYDHDGNWFFGNTTGTTGTVTLNNLTINGTCTGCGSGSAYPFTSSTWNTYNVQATTSQLRTTGMYISSSSDPIADLGGNALPGSWPMMLWNPISATGSSTGLAFGVSSTVGGSPGAGIGFIRQGANSYGDLFFATADNGSAMTEKMRIKGSGNIGLASTTPFGLLSINPNGITGPSFAIGSSTKTDFVVTNGGRVGIGTSSPTVNLDVQGSSAKIRLGDNGANTNQTFELMRNNAVVGGFSTSNSTLNLFGGTAVSNANTMIIRNGPIVSVGTSTNNSSSMFNVAGGVTLGVNWAGQFAAPTSGMLVEGKVAIGTTSAITEMVIAKSGGTGPTLTFSDSSVVEPAGMFLINDANDKLKFFRGRLGVSANEVFELNSTVQNASRSLGIQNVSGGVFTGTNLTYFPTSGLSYFNNNGSVAMGTTTTGNYQLVIASTTAPQLSLSAGTGLSQWTLRNAGGNFYLATTTVAGTATSTQISPFEIRNDGTAYLPFTGTSGSAQTGYWCYDANGQLIRTTTTCLVSARKYKKDINDLNLGLSDLLKLQPVSYYLKDKRFGSEKQIGFIADDVPDYMKEVLVSYDENGDIRGFKYEQFTSLLTQSIKDLNNKVDNLPQYASKAKRSAEENWQWVFIVLLIVWNLGLTKKIYAK